MNDPLFAPRVPRGTPGDADADRLAAALDVDPSAEVAETGEVAQLARLAGALVALPGLPPDRRAAIDRAVLDRLREPPGDDGRGAPPAARPLAGRLGGLALGVALLALAGRAVVDRVGDASEARVTPLPAATQPPATRVARAAGPRPAERTSRPPATGTARTAAPREAVQWIAPPDVPSIAPSATGTAEPPSPVTPLPAASGRPERGSHAARDRSPTPEDGGDGCAVGDGPGGGIAVRVVRSGLPLADADVAAGRAPDGPLEALAVTDAAGCARIGLGPGGYHVRVGHDGAVRWFRDAPERAGADVVLVADAPVPLTIAMDDAGAPSSTVTDTPPASPATEPATPEATPPVTATEAIATAPPPGIASGASGRPSLVVRASSAAPHPASGAGAPPNGTWDDAPSAVASNPPDQTGGAVTDVAFDPRQEIFWTVIGPRAAAWRLHRGSLEMVGVSPPMPEVPEAIAHDGVTVAVGVPGNGQPAAIWLFDARAPARPAARAIVPLSSSGANVIGALAMGDGLAWALTDVGLSLVDLKPAVPVEVGWLSDDAMVGGRLAAPDSLDWQGGVAVLEGRRMAVVVRPWGLAVVDGADPAFPRARSSGRGGGDRAEWPAFDVATRGARAALVDVGAPGPGVLTVLDVGGRSAPRVAMRLDLAGLEGFDAASSRDDPVHGRSRGPAVAWAGDDLVVLAANARAWAVARWSETEAPMWIGGGLLAAWDASRARLATVADGAGPDAQLPFVAAAGDAGLLANLREGSSVAAQGITPPLWQSSVSGDGRWLFGAAGRAGLVVADLSAGRTQGTRGLRLSVEGGACGSVVAVAATAFGAVALTEACGLVTVAAAPDEVRVLGHVAWSRPLSGWGVPGSAALAARDGLVAWVEPGKDGRVDVVVADTRVPERPRRLGTFRPRGGDPIAVALLPDWWLVVAIDPLGSSVLEVWPPGLGADRPTASLPLEDAYQSIVQAPGGVVLSGGLGQAGGVVYVALDRGVPRSIAQRAGWGRGAVATFDAAFGGGRRLVASDGLQLAAFDPGRELAMVGGTVPLPHGRLRALPQVAPWRDDVHVAGTDVVVTLGDAGIMRFRSIAAGASQRPEQAPSRRWAAHLPFAASWDHDVPSPVGVLMLDGSREGAAWLAAHGGGAAVANAAAAWSTTAGSGLRLAFVRWDDWALQGSPLAHDANARVDAAWALAAAVVQSPGRMRRPDAALALAGEVLAGAPGGARPRRVLLAAAGSPEQDSLHGARARARALAAAGVELVVVALVGPEGVVDPSWAVLANDGGTVLRTASNARELAFWAGSPAGR